MSKIKAKEITQLVTIELVTGSDPIVKTLSATTLTPSPAPCAMVQVKESRINFANIFTKGKKKYVRIVASSIHF